MKPLQDATTTRFLRGLLLLIFFVWTTGAHAQTYTILHTFSGFAAPTGIQGSEPEAGLILSNNTLYGTTEYGGDSGEGTVFAVHPDGSGFTNLHSFATVTPPMLAFTNDGANPQASLIVSGNRLYGTARYGGSNGWGTVFAANLDGTGVTTLHGFTNGVEGAGPVAGLTLSGATLFGTTQSGGISNAGTVFSINTDGSGFTNIHTFTRGEDGAYPGGGLVIMDNILYGTTENGGTNFSGSIFAVNTNGSGFTNLHYFTGADGSIPAATLTLSGATLYGTTESGGIWYSGTIFAIQTDGSEFTNFYSFTGYADGSDPQATLVLSNNILYGTAAYGGTNNSGTVFAIDTSGSNFATLYSFTRGSDGATPVGALFLTNNTLYGTTEYGGSLSNGTVFALNASSLSFTNLYTFTGGDDGGYPEAGLVGDTLYGTAFGGGNAGYGTLFALQIDGTGFTVLHYFVPPYAEPYEVNSDGANPVASLVLSGNTLYGTTPYGGSWGHGTVFAVNTDGTGFSNIYTFTAGADGANPVANLVLSGDTLYGTTEEGGFQYNGTVFSLHTDGSDFTVLHRFTAEGDGATPMAGLVLSSNILYGTTLSGGTHYAGTIFAINTDGTGFSIVYSFTAGNDGQGPAAALTLSNNILYGTAEYGGTNGLGTVFSVQVNGSNFTLLHPFTGDPGGGNPRDPLLLLGSTLYGTTYSGGISNNGTVFAIQTGGSGFTNLYSFTGGNDGANPPAGMVLSGGALYGATANGGTSGVGALFSIQTDGMSFTNFHSFVPYSGGFSQLNGDGAYPLAGLLRAGGTLFGTAANGGSAGYGTVFSLLTNGSNFATLYNFTNGSDGAYPYAALIRSGDTLYGTASGGGTYAMGTVFSLNTNGSGFTNLHSFSGVNDGTFPSGSLLLWSNALYGTTSTGGTSNKGTVFVVNPDGSGFSTLYSFTGGNDGATPYASLAVWSNSFLIGTAWGGGTSGNGTLFAIKVTPTAQAAKLGGPILFFDSFPGGTGGNNPEGPVDIGRDGSLSFTTGGSGVPGDYGTVGWTSFNDMTGFGSIGSTAFSGLNGAGPDGGLLCCNGFWWGTAESRGALGFGSLFAYDPTSADIIDVFDFSGGNFGEVPTGSLIAVDHSLIGSAAYGGSGETGVLFAYNPCPGTESFPAPSIGQATYGAGSLQFSFSTSLTPSTPEDPDSRLRATLFNVIGSSPSDYPVLGSFEFHDNGTGGMVTGSHSLMVPTAPTAIALSFSTSCGQSLLSSPAMVMIETAPSYPGTSAANAIWSGFDGCPVSTLTGELFELLPPDLVVGGPMPLRFQRYYAASIKRDGFITGRLGDNWLHNFEMLLIPPSSNIVEVITQFGRVIQFTNTGAAYALMGRSDVPYQLTNSGAAYIFGDPYSQQLYTFSSTGELTEISDGHGNAQTLSYSAGLLANVKDGFGHSLSFQYNASGQLTNVSDGARSVGFAQEGALLTQAVDALGYVTTYSYDTTNAISGLLTGTTQPNGNAPFLQTFNSSGQVIAQVEAGIVPGTNTFSYSNGAAIMTDPFGNQVRQTNNAAGALVSLTDAGNQTSSFAYNAAGQRASVTNRLGQVTLLGYHAPSGKLAAITNADGTVSTITYAPRIVSGITFYDPVQLTFPDATTESFTYDSFGNVLTHTDRAGQTWSFSYNAHGQMLNGTNPAGGVANITYNADGTPASMQNSDTGLTFFFSDQFSRLTNVVHPDGTGLSLVYDADSRIVRFTNELGRAFGAAYDGNNNLTQLIDAEGQVTHLNYDPRNRLRQFIDPLNAATTFIYDARGSDVTNVSPTGDTTVNAYDTRRRLIATTDPDANTWTRGFDDEDFLVSAANPLGQTGALVRNAVNSVTNAIDPMMESTQLTRDALQRVVLTLDPLSRSNTFAYDPRSVLSGAGVQSLGAAAYQRNSLGLVSRITDLNGNEWNYTYTPMGRPLSVSDPLNRATAFTYDSRGRFHMTTYADGTVCTNIYDAANNLRQLQYSAGPDLAYSYDALNRITNAGDLTIAYDQDGRVTNTSASGVNFGAGYDLSGRVTKALYDNGALAVLYQYDHRGLVTNVADSLSGASVSLAYDAAGRLVGITRGNGADGTYTYDADGRVTHIREGAFLNLDFKLDSAGEIVSDAITAPLDPASLIAPTLANFRYNAAHEIVASGYAYDERGRETAAPGSRFAWDGASRLTSLNGVTFGYNGLSQLETRAQGGVTHRYFYNEAFNPTPIMADRNESTGLVERYYVWTPGGRLLYYIDALHGNAVYYYHFDQLGSTLALTTSGGAVSDAYAYSPYGMLLAHSGTNTQPFTFIGQFGARSESSPNLYQLRARYYDAASAAFISPDPTGADLFNPVTANPYEYANRNPNMFFDATGQSARINNNGGPHSDISVDVWSGGKIIGVLTATFGGKDWTLGIKPLQAVTTGLPGQVGWDFHPGQTVTATASPTDTIVPGTQQQDEALTAHLGDVIANQSHAANPDAANQQVSDFMTSLKNAAAKHDADPDVTGMLHGTFVPVYGDFVTYYGWKRNCNDFTRAAVETYLGAPLVTPRPTLVFEASDLIQAYKDTAAQQKEEVVDPADPHDNPLGESWRSFRSWLSSLW